MISRRALVVGGLASWAFGPKALAHYLPLDLATQADAHVDRLIRTAMAHQHISALSLAVVKDGVVRCAAYGQADRARPIPALPETTYNIASLGKQFLASAVMLLNGNGKIGLDEKAVTYLQGTFPLWKDITVTHLLTHTSGLLTRPIGYDPFVQRSDAEVIRRSYRAYKSTPPIPGKAFNYSNLGYFILTEIIRRVTGDGWSKFVEKAVFEPAGLSMTLPASRAPLAVGYSWTGRDYAPRRVARTLRPAGPFATMVLDLAQWDQVLRTDKVLTDAMRQKMWTPAALSTGVSNYGFAWRLASSPHYGPIVYHSGGADALKGTGGFTSFMWRYLQQNVAVIILTNAHKVSLKKLSYRVARHYLPPLPAGASVPPEVDVEEEGHEDMDD